MWKKEKCWIPTFSPFQSFLLFLHYLLLFSTKSNMSSAFTLEESKILSSGKEGSKSMFWKSNLFMEQALVFMCLQHKSFEITEGKGKITRYKQFLLFPHCFLPFGGRTSTILIKLKNIICKLFPFKRI